MLGEVVLYSGARHLSQQPGEEGVGGEEFLGVFHAAQFLFSLRNGTIAGAGASGRVRWEVSMGEPLGS